MGGPRSQKPAVAPRHLTAAQFAERVGVSRSTVSEWIKAGLLDVDEDGRVPPVQGMRQVKALRRKRAGLGVAAAVPDETKVKAQSAFAREREAKAALRELELAAARGDLVERAEVEKDAQTAGEAIRAALFAIPPRVSLQLEALVAKGGARAPEIEALITDEINAALQALQEARFGRAEGA